MTQFYSLFLKEFQSYFRTHTAYFIMFIYIVLSMIATFYSGYFFVLNNTDMVSFFSFQPDILAVLIPAVTMRLWADERKIGTIEFILTQPIKYSTLVWSKYLASVAFCIILLSLTFGFWIYLNLLTQADNINIFSGYIGCLLVASTFCAIGCVVSSFSTNAVIAYLISVFLSWGLISINFNFIVDIISKITDISLNNDIQSFNFSNHFYSFTSGQIGPDNIIYFVSIIALALWFNIFAVEYKRN